MSTESDVISTCGTFHGLARYRVYLASANESSRPTCKDADMCLVNLELGEETFERLSVCLSLSLCVCLPVHFGSLS